MNELTRALGLLLEECRLKLITSLIVQAMPIFESQGFTLEELLDGLSRYIEMETEWQQAVHHIEEAATAIRNAKKGT